MAGVGDTRTLKVVVVGNARGAQSALRGLGVTANRTGVEVHRAGSKVAGFGRMLSVAGKAGAIGLGVAAAAAVKFTLSVGAAYSTSLNKLQGLTRVTDEQLSRISKRLEASRKDFAKLGFSVGEAAAGVVELVKAGRSIEEAMTSIKDVMVLATAGEMSVAEAASFASDMLNAFRLKASDAARVANTLANGANLSSVNIDDLRQSLQQASAVASIAGLSIEQTTAALAILGNMGLKGSDAGTSLKTFITRLTTDIDGSADMLKELGVNVFDAKGQMRDFPRIIGEVAVAISKLSDKDRSQVLYDIFGSDAIRAANIFGKNGVEAIDKIIKGVSEAGAAQRVAEARTKGAAGAWREFKANVTSLSQAFYREHEPALEAVIRGMTSLLDKGKDVRRFLGRVRDAFTSSAKGSGRLAEITERFKRLVSTVLPELRRFAAFIRADILPVILDLWRKAQPVLRQLQATFVSVLDAIIVAVRIAAGAIRIFWSIFGGMILSVVKGFFGGVFQAIKGALQIIQGVLDVFTGLLSGEWGRAWNGLKTIVTGALNAIVGIVRALFFGRMLALIRSGLMSIVNVYRGGWQSMISTVRSAAGTIVQWAKAILTGVRGIVRELVATMARLPGKMLGAMKGVVQKFYDVGKNIVKGLMDGIKGAAGGLLGTVKDNLIDKPLGAIKSGFGIFSPSRVTADLGKWIVEGFVVGFTKNANRLDRAVANLTQRMRDSLSGETEDRVVGIIRRANARLNAAIAKRERIAARLKAAQARLAQLVADKAKLKESIKDGILSFGGIMGTKSDDVNDMSPAGIVGRFTAQLAKVRKFNADLAAMGKRGLSADLIRQIAEAGVEEGSQMLAGLYNATPAQIAELNRTNAAIAAEAGAGAERVAGQLYNAGIRAAQGLVNGLKSQHKAVEDQILAIARAMVGAIKRALGIKSPSRVFMDLGRNTGAGFAEGVVKSKGDVLAAMNDLAGQRPADGKAGVGVGAGGSAVMVNVTVNVAGNVTSEKDLAKAIAPVVRDEIVRIGKRNGGRTGL